MRNIGENGRLQPVGAFPDGTPLAYRIVDPALYILQVKFDLQVAQPRRVCGRAPRPGGEDFKLA